MSKIALLISKAEMGLARDSDCSRDKVELTVVFVYVHKRRKKEMSKIALEY